MHALAGFAALRIDCQRLIQIGQTGFGGCQGGQQQPWLFPLRGQGHRFFGPPPRGALRPLLERRLDVNFLYSDTMDSRGDEVRETLCAEFESSLSTYLATHLDSSAWIDALSALADCQATAPDDKLELARQAVLRQRLHEAVRAAADLLESGLSIRPLRIAIVAGGDV